VQDAWLPVFAEEQGRFEFGRFGRWRPVVQRWRYDWGWGHVRGLDVMTLRGDGIAEKFAFGRLVVRVDKWRRRIDRGLTRRIGREGSFAVRRVRGAGCGVRAAAGYDCRCWNFLLGERTATVMGLDPSEDVLGRVGMSEHAFDAVF
jgi:hypothetical protein